MKGYIYRYYNIITNKSYIGQTTNIVNRNSSHKLKATYVKNKFYNAVRKYGWESFEYSIIAEIEAPTTELCTLILDNLEVLFISKYNSYNNGYNSTVGGHSARGMKRSEEYKNYCKNRKYSESTRTKMREAALHRVVSEKTREKCRLNAIRRNFSSYRELTADKRNEAIRKVLSKKIIQLDINNNVVKEFSSLSNAVTYIKNNIASKLTLKGIEQSLIRHCKGYTKKREYYGFIWKYKTDC